MPGSFSVLFPRLTSSRLEGAVVPMPTLVAGGCCPPQSGAELMLPKTRELLSVTNAHAPIAVALVKLFEPKSALQPRTVLEEPMVLPLPALCPKKELFEPDVLKLPTSSPMNVLKLPVFETPALDPKMEFDSPSVLKAPAPCPKYELKKPEVLLSPAP